MSGAHRGSSPDRRSSEVGHPPAAEPVSPAVAMTIAGSDSGGGAGIQADLRTFAALGVFGTTSVTAVTAQSSTEVRAVHLVPAEMVVAQVLTVLDDMAVSAVKTGMLGDVATVRAVAELARAGRLPRLVVDPVLVASSGTPLASDEALRAYRQVLLPEAAVVTPNIPEAGALLGAAPAAFDDPGQLARRLGERTAALVVVTGGHGRGADRAVDVMWDGAALHEIGRPWVETENTHGSGCTFSAAVAAQLARGADPLQAVRLAGDLVHRAIEGSRLWRLGAGPGPLDHFDWANRCSSAQPGAPDAPAPIDRTAPG